MSAPTYFDWLTLLAIILGPIIGVAVTRFIDSRNDAQRRREAVFEGLLRTRGLELSPDHVGSLNMVPVLFTEKAVRDAYSRVMGALNDPALGSEDPKVFEGALIRLNAARNDLIREIAGAVGLPLPQNELERAGYAPQAWVRQQHEQDALRTLLIEWLEGKRATNMVAGIWELQSAPPPTETARPAIPDSPDDDTPPATKVARPRKPRA